MSSVLGANVNKTANESTNADTTIVKFACSTKLCTIHLRLVPLSKTEEKSQEYKIYIKRILYDRKCVVLSKSNWLVTLIVSANVKCPLSHILCLYMREWNIQTIMHSLYEQS